MRGPALRSPQLLLLATFSAALLTSCSTFVLPGGQPAPPKTYVAVGDLVRVLIFKAPLTTGESASVVLGQSNFDQDSNDNGQANGFEAQALAADAAGNLFVADAWGCRVLEFRPPYTNGMDASLVIGQPGFASTGCPGGDGRQPSSVSATDLVGPSGVAVDAQGNMWVSDFYASRITEYRPPFTNGMAASLVIGQVNFENAFECNGGNFTKTFPIPRPSASTLCAPTGIAFDAQGNLWVVDFGNYRVLEFRPPFSTGMAASLEIGQPANNPFGSSSKHSASASTLCSPYDLAFDRSGDLWVGDGGCSRALQFRPPFTNGMAASVVIGQPDFAHGGPPPQAPESGMPLSGVLASDEPGQLLVGANCQVQIFAPPFSNGMSFDKVLGHPGTMPGECGPPSANTIGTNVSTVVAF